jgi:DNA-binding CsgD family transcriptional regulator
VRAAVYQGATFAERSAAHGALARVLIGEPDADRRAWHRAAAATGPDESIAAGLEHTAARAQQRLGYAAAAIALERAARLTPEPPDRARRLVAAATAAMHAGRAGAAITLADQALRLTAEPAALARIATVRAWVAMERGSLRSAHELLVAGAAPIVGLDPVSATAMLRDAVRAGWWAGDARLVQDAATLLRPALAGTGSERAALVCDGLQAMADLLAGHPDRAVPPLRNVVAAARRDPPAELDARDTTGTFAMLVGDFDASRALLLSTAEGCRSQGKIRSLPLVHWHLAYTEFRLNRFRAAAVSATEGLRLAHDTDQPVHIAGLNAVLALLAAVSGDEPLCRDLATQALDQFAGEIADVSAMAEWALGLLDLGHGQFDAALERFETTASGPMRHHIHPVYFATDQVEAAARLGAPDRAEEPLARFAAWAGASGQPWALAVLHRCRALLDKGAGAEDNYRAALGLHARSGRPFEHARSAMLYGEWLRRSRRPADARTQLRAALALLDRAGATPWADRARAELRAAGESTMSGTPAPDKLSLLTPQELQVVRLAASGATNRDIAAQLFLSPRTISHHLYRAFPKLGVTTRTALARLDLALSEEDLT